MVGIMLIIVGLALNVVDIRIPTNFNYPSYEITSELGKTFQKYVTSNLIGDRFKIDIFSDAIGYILILAGLLFLAREYKKFITPCIFAMIALGVYIALPFMPFKYNGKTLCFTALHLSFLLVVLNVIMQGLIVSKVMRRITAMEAERKVIAMKIGCIIAMVCNVVVYLTNFLGLDYLTVFYTLVLYGCSAWYLIMMYQVRGYFDKKKK